MAKDTSEFVFVDEAHHSPGLKALNRRRVRAQARSTAARLLIQKHEKGRRKSELTAFRDLVPQEREHGTSLIQEHTLPVTIRRRPEFSRIGSSETSSESIVSDTTVSSTPRLQDKLAFYSRFYGPASYSVGSKTSQSLYNYSPSPQSLLGAGKVDPFLTLPVKEQNPDIHNLVNLYTTYILPGIYPDDDSNQASSINTIAKAWVSASVATPFLLNILLWSVCIKRDIIRGHRAYDRNAQGLLYKVEGIRQLNEVLSNGKEAVTDEVILGIAGLATHEVVNFTGERAKPFNSPLQQAGLLHTYGGLQMVPEHREALLRLISLRGGIESLKLTGLSEGMVIGEICGVMNSCFTLKPVFPPLLFHERYVAAVKRWARTTSIWSAPKILGQSFRQLPECGLTDAMLEVLDCMEAITRAIEHYLLGKHGCLSLGQIIRTRTGIQKRLLILPTSKELDPARSSLPNLYESCRLTAMIFSVAVIYPIPNTYDVLQTLVRELTASLEVTDIESQTPDYFGLLLWMLVLGGIAALEKPERTWFVSNLALLSQSEGVRLEWERIEEIVKRFLWLECACSPGGRKLWDEVMSYRKKEDAPARSLPSSLRFPKTEILAQNGSARFKF